ncbi:T9SS type B sorting domain-containing protein [Flavobacterium sp.]|uniref:T9SS type B sorting domain-containing protein n=1 Tax=Flavobacterium sp. TaxID=239 RepID=UPI00286D74B2|nr:T9SS type B sorting domain-containing protein [Flavobacterium sp.]
MKLKFTSLFFFVYLFQVTVYSQNPQVIISDHNGNNNNTPNNTGIITIDCDYNFIPPKKIQLTATFPDLKNPTDYTATQVAFNQVGNFSDGTVIPYTSDDQWSSNIAIGFPFCFYGNTYTSLNVADNGIVRFNYNPLNPETSFSSISNQVPSPSLVRNAIFGGFQDLINAPGVFGCNTGQNCGTISTILTGTAPFRKFVINYNQVNHFGCSGSNTKQSTFQIVLFESTNVVEINVKDKPLTCLGNSSGNNGITNSLIGLNNADGTQGIAAPNRNTSVWSATDESYRFVPSGLSTTTIEWFNNAGVSLGIQNPIEVIPTVGNPTYTVKVNYATCTPIAIQSTINVNFDLNYPVAPDLVRNYCDDTPPFLSHIIDIEPELIDANDNPITVKTLHNTQNEADLGINPQLFVFTMTTPTRVFYYRETIGICYVTGKITLNLQPTPQITDQQINICDIGNNGTEVVTLSSLNPQISGFNAGTMGTTYFLTLADAQAGLFGTTITTATVATVPGFTEVFVRVRNSTNVNCWAVAKIRIQLLPLLDLAPITTFCIPNTDFNTVENFDISTIIPSILTGPALLSDITYNYYSSASNATTGSNPITNLSSYPVTIIPPATTATIYIGAEASGTYCRTIEPIVISFCVAEGGDNGGNGGNGGSGGSGFDVCLDDISDPIPSFDLNALFTTVMANVLPPIATILTTTGFYTTLIGAQTQDISVQLTVAEVASFTPTQPAAPALFVPIWVRYTDGNGNVGIKQIIIPFKYKKNVLKDFPICDTFNDNQENVDLLPYIAQIQLENPGETILCFENLSEYLTGDPNDAITVANVQSPSTIVYVKVSSYGCDSKYDLNFILEPFATTTIVKNVCDIGADGTENVNLSLILADIIPTYPVNSIFTIHSAEAGAYNETNLIANTNTSYPINPAVSVWIRIEPDPLIVPVVCPAIIKIDFGFSNSISTNPFTAYEVCDTDNDGFVTLNAMNAFVASIVNETLAEPIIKKLYTNLQDAQLDNGNNLISVDWNTYVYDSTTLGVNGFVYLFLENTITNCTRVLPIPISVQSITLATNPTVTYCDFENNNSETIPLMSIFNPQITTNYFLYNFQYYTNEPDAIAGTNAILPNFPVVDGTIVYVKITTGANATCSKIIPVEIDLIQSPIITDFTAEICDNLGNGTEIVNLYSYQNQLVSPALPATFTFQYYASQSNALQDLSAFSNFNTINYNITSFDANNLSAIVFVKVTNPVTKCFSIAKLNFKRQPIIEAFDEIQFTCDISTTNQLQGVFNLETSIPRTGTNGMILNPTNYTITYHNTFFLATSAGTQIPTPTAHTVIGDQTSYVYVRFVDNITLCYTVKRIELQIYNLPKFLDSTIDICDDDLDGDYVIDLVSLNGVVVFDPSPFTFQYFLSQFDADADSNPITTNINNYNILISEFPKAIFVKGTDVINSCSRTKSVIIQNLPQVPLITANPTLTECDDNNDGIATFNLTDAQLLITAQTGVTFTYFRTLQEMQANNNPIVTNIINPNSYTNSVTNPLTVYVRLSSPVTNCDSYAQITLVPFYKTYIFPTQITLCDDNADNTEEVNLATITFDIIAPETTADVVLSFYNTYAQALLGTSTIPNPYTFTNFSTPIFVKITNIVSQCSSIEQLKFVKPDPILVFSTQESKCDLNSNGIQFFDPEDSFATMTTPANPSIYSITSYSSEAGANEGITSPDLIPNTNHQVNQPQEIIWIRFVDSYGCYSVKSLTLNVLPLPLAGPMTTYYSCKDVVTGKATFDLSSKNVEALAGQNPLQFSVSYHSTSDDAKSGANALPFLYESVTTTIWVSIKNNSTGCRNIASLNLNAEIATTITAPRVASTTYCDNDGINNGFTNIDLSILDASILGSIQNGNPDYAIQYFASLANFNANIPIVNSNFYTNIQNPQTIIAQIINNGTNQKCEAHIPFEIKVNLLPVVVPVVEILVCDVDNNGVEVFDLTKVQFAGTSQVTTENNVSYTYFRTLAELQSNQNAINSPSNYINQFPNPSVVFVKVTFNLTRCFSYSTINLNPFHTDYNFPISINLCDNNADGSEKINLTQITYGILAPLTLTDVSVAFYSSFNDAFQQNQAFQTPEEYSISNYNTPIYVRITDSTLLCSSIEVLNFTKYSPIIVNNFSTSKCDLDNNGIQSFDLANYFGSMTITPNTPSNYTITSYTSEAGANEGITSPDMIPNSNYQVNQPEKIVWIRFQDSNGCYSVKPLTLKINPLPVVVPMSDFYVCRNTGSNQATFDLSTKNIQATSGEINPSQFTVSYHLTEADAKTGNGSLPNSYTSISITIWVSLRNNITNCRNVSPLSLVAELETTATQPNPNTTLVCDTDDDNDGFTKFDLSTLNAGILGSPQNGNPNYVIQYYASQSDLNSINPITDLANFTNTSNPQTIFVSVVNTTTVNKCDATLSFVYKVNKLAETTPNDGTVCFDQTTGNLLSSHIIDSGLSTIDYTFEWYLGTNPTPISGQTGATFEATSAGEYFVIATDKLYPNCSSKPNFATVIRSEPAIASASVEYSFADNIKVVITATGLGDYSYQIDDESIQESNIFENVQYGTHLITVYDGNGCESTKLSVIVLDYDKFFTPNGDGYNEHWNIKGIKDQPNAKVYLFDRYGKLLKQISPTSEGWNGIYNGQPLPADDYWFTVTYMENGQEKIFKSHFAMKR